MPRARTVCSLPGCPQLATEHGRGRCAKHPADTRPNWRQRGYDHRGHEVQFRRAVLARDPVCVICRKASSTDADHHPLTRRELLARGLDPNKASAGRGLCHPCHSRHTALSRVTQGDVTGGDEARG
jgi:5-methylcytosine-specific restriction protein A